MTIDLVIVRDERALGIDLLGHPGPYGDVYPLERTRMLHRAGLSIFTLPFSRWRMDSSGCVNAIEDRWAQAHVDPAPSLSGRTHAIDTGA